MKEWKSESLSYSREITSEVGQAVHLSYHNRPFYEKVVNSAGRSPFLLCAQWVFFCIMDINLTFFPLSVLIFKSQCSTTACYTMNDEQQRALNQQHSHERHFCVSLVLLCKEKFLLQYCLEPLNQYVKERNLSLDTNNNELTSICVKYMLCVFMCYGE